MRKHLKAEILSSRYYGYKYNPEKPYSILAGLDDTELGTLNELLAVIRQLQHTKEGIRENFIGLGTSGRNSERESKFTD